MVFFDVEMKCVVKEVGGWYNLYKFGVVFVVSCDFEEGVFKIFCEE